MKKIHILIVVALSLSVIFYFFHGLYSPIKNYPPRNTIVVAFGDSLIEGRGATTGNDLVSLLSRKLDNPIINLGVAGNTTGEGLARINEVFIHSPGTVILLLGGNDYLRNIPEQETFDNLQTIITDLQSQGIFVILLGVRGGIFRDNYKSEFDSLAKEMGVLYVPDVLNGIYGDSRYMSDVVHPNDAGYKKIAERVYAAIHDYIQISFN